MRKIGGKRLVIGRELFWLQMLAAEFEVVTMVARSSSEAKKSLESVAEFGYLMEVWFELGWDVSFVGIYVCKVYTIYMVYSMI